MTKALWEKERNTMFWDLYREYKEEGYNNSEAKALAKKEVDEVIEDKQDIVSYLLSDDLFE